MYEKPLNFSHKTIFSHQNYSVYLITYLYLADCQTFSLFFSAAGWWIRQAHTRQLVRRWNLQADAATGAIWFSTSQSLHGE
jgi:hypothetical protein